MAQEAIVFDVGPGEFDTRVLAASAEAAIVTDFWAPWCAPCRMLGPVLERVVRGMGGRVRLARVNVDEVTDVAARYNIQGIPAVKVFRGGQVVAEFVGALPEAEVRRILEQAVPSAADELVQQADERLAGGDLEGARRLCRKALSDSPRHPGAALRLARFALQDGDADEARRLASLVEEGTPEHEQAAAVLARLEFAERCRQAGGLDACRRRTQQDPADLEARYGLACCLAAGESYEEALEELLRIVRADKRWQDEAARKAMLRIFSIVGKRSPLADRYRDLLARALY